MKSHWQPIIDGFLLWLFIIVVTIVVGLIVMATTGCTGTITPKPVAGTQASFSGNQQTSGILAADPAGYVVTADFRDRYNALIAVYGKDILPPLKPDAGITPRADGTWLIDKQHLVDEILMADWRRMGRTP